MNYTHPMEVADFVRRLRDRVKKLAAVKPHVEKITGDADAEIRAIKRSPEYQLAERTGGGNVRVFDERMAEIRAKAKAAVAKLAADVSSEIEYLRPAIAESRDTGSFAKMAGGDAVRSGWERAEVLLKAGIAPLAVVELAKADDDREMLAGLEKYAPTWLRAAAGRHFADETVQRGIAAVLMAIEAATDGMLTATGREFRDMEREFGFVAHVAESWIDYGHRAADGRATAGDKIALGFETGDVPDRPAERPDNGLRADASGVLEGMEGAKGIGVTVSE